MADDLFARAKAAGYWTAFVTDNRPDKRLLPNANLRVMGLLGRFATETEALAAADAAIASGWVVDTRLHRETAKACADFNLPREVVNEIGRFLEAQQ